eukprot:2201530-Amphidinium_carterae.4
MAAERTRKSTASPIGNHYCENDLYNNCWHLHAVETDYASNKTEPLIPLRATTIMVIHEDHT